MDASCASRSKAPPAVALKRCAKCQTTHSQAATAEPSAAQQAAQPNRQARRQQAGGSSAAPALGGLSPPKGCEGPISKPFHRLDAGTLLRGRPEKDVFTLLIDAHRLRVEDDYNLEGDATPGSVYDGSEHGLEGLRDFLDDAERVPGLQPQWWDPQKRRQCELLGMNGSSWPDLRKGVEKSEIIEHYGDPQFPMQLRMFAESVLGSGPGGQSGTGMRKMMMRMEAGAPGGMHMSHMSLG